MTSLRREKAKLLRHVHSSFDSSELCSKNHQGRSSLLPQPPEMKLSHAANLHKDASASTLSSRALVSPIHRIAHQRMPRKSHLIYGQQTDSCLIANGRSVPHKHRAPLTNPILEGDSSNCTLKHLTYRQVQGACVPDLRRSLPTWKP